ncbi:hypothetical protein CO690_00190 (plasmid) [Rothia mucilaginosa]|uniref:Uncharacterized protein n=1 Tax=Rothia mucilaginosa TaxID=43675 RepID=A0A291DCY2_9MICC|nr:hypothetical protein CO690_00190 [Rothia mucilaginosa]
MKAISHETCFCDHCRPQFVFVAEKARGRVPTSSSASAERMMSMPICMTDSRMAMMPMTITKIAMPGVMPEVKTATPRRVASELLKPSSVDLLIIQLENWSPALSNRVTAGTAAAATTKYRISEVSKSIRGWPLRVVII